MKLWQKLSLVTVAVLLLTSVISGGAVIYRSVAYNQEKTLENYEQQLISTAYALSRELQSSSLESYREATKNSYLNFLIRRYGASEYILLENGQVICNETPYELSDPGNIRWMQEEAFSIIQRSGETYILLAGKRVPMSGDTVYGLVLVKDISVLYREVRLQAFFYLLVYLVGALMSAILVFLLTRRILKPLFELQRAAKDISGGELTRRAHVCTRDETGILAKAFNVMAEKIESQVTELEEESERRRQMLGSLAHELKTPMTSIIGYSDSLLHVKLKEEQKERALLHIYEESRRLERLSSKMLSLVGMYDNDSIAMTQVKIRELFEQAAELEAYHLKEKGIELCYFCDEESGKLDKDLMVSLLINLIDNAVKASRQGDKITLGKEGNVIFVEDQGCGIPKDELARVTEAFYMVDKARSRKEGGSGLGLALCSRIAGLHGAKLEIESELQKGTRVSLVFEEWWEKK